jgi:hypothetical protein
MPADRPPIGNACSEAGMNGGGHEKMLMRSADRMSLAAPGVIPDRLNPQVHRLFNPFPPPPQPRSTTTGLTSHPHKTGGSAPAGSVLIVTSRSLSSTSRRQASRSPLRNTFPGQLRACVAALRVHASRFGSAWRWPLRRCAPSREEASGQPKRLPRAGKVPGCGQASQRWPTLRASPWA